MGARSDDSRQTLLCLGSEGGRCEGSGNRRCLVGASVFAVPFFSLWSSVVSVGPAALQVNQLRLTSWKRKGKTKKEQIRRKKCAAELPHSAHAFPFQNFRTCTGDEWVAMGCEYRKVPRERPPPKHLSLPVLGEIFTLLRDSDFTERPQRWPAS